MSVESAVVAECPKCGKKALVQRNNDQYECMWCDFRKDFSESKQTSSSADDVLPMLVLVVIVLLFALQFITPKNTRYPVIEPVPTKQSR